MLLNNIATLTILTSVFLFATIEGKAELITISDKTTDVEIFTNSLECTMLTSSPDKSPQTTLYPFVTLTINNTNNWGTKYNHNSFTSNWPGHANGDYNCLNIEQDIQQLGSMIVQRRVQVRHLTYLRIGEVLTRLRELEDVSLTFQFDHTQVMVLQSSAVQELGILPGQNLSCLRYSDISLKVRHHVGIGSLAGKHSEVVMEKLEEAFTLAFQERPEAQLLQVSATLKEFNGADHIYLIRTRDKIKDATGGSDYLVSVNTYSGQLNGVEFQSCWDQNE